MNIYEIFNFMCSEADCEHVDLSDIAKAYKHVQETGHEVYQFVMFGDKPHLCAIIDEKIVSKTTNKKRKKKEDAKK